jgi:hypothetical protein
VQQHSGSITGNVTGADPLLDPSSLQDNGGPTNTIGLQPGSPAVGMGVTATDPVTMQPVAEDQRGLARTDPLTIGAYQGPRLTTAASVNLGTATYGTAGVPQAFTVSGVGLTNSVVILTPRGVEIRQDSQTTWLSSLTLTPDNSGTLLSTTIDVRIQSLVAAGTITGILIESSPGAPEHDVSVNGTVQPAPLTVTPAAGQSMGYGAAVPLLSYTASGFVNNDPPSTLGGTLGTSATSTSPVANYPFTVSSLSAGNNYTVVLAANAPSFAVTTVQPTVGVDAVNITYGTPLDNSQLSGSASWTVDGTPVIVPGTFTYTSASVAGSVLNAGNGQTEAVTFTPNDSTDYTTAATTVLVNVQQATPQVSVSDNGGPYNGQPFAAQATATGVGGVTVQGSFTYAYMNSQNQLLAAAPSAVGSYSAIASFQSADPNYASADSAPVGFTIAPGPSGPITTDTPSFAWTAVSGATYYSFKITAGKAVVRTRDIVGTTTYALTAAQALTPGHTYTWSVIAVSRNGRIRVAGPSMTFTVAALAAPTLLSFASATDTFSWQAVADAGHYSLEVVDIASGVAVLRVRKLTATMYQLNTTLAKALKPGRSYTWYVTAVSTNGRVSVRSAAANFRI